MGGGPLTHGFRSSRHALGGGHPAHRSEPGAVDVGAANWRAAQNLALDDVLYASPADRTTRQLGAIFHCELGFQMLTVGIDCLGAEV